VGLWWRELQGVGGGVHAQGVPILGMQVQNQEGVLKKYVIVVSGVGKEEEDGMETRFGGVYIIQFKNQKPGALGYKRGSKRVLEEP